MFPPRCTLILSMLVPSHRQRLGCQVLDIAKSLRHWIRTPVPKSHNLDSNFAPQQTEPWAETLPPADFGGHWWHTIGSWQLLWIFVWQTNAEIALFASGGTHWHRIGRWPLASSVLADWLDSIRRLFQRVRICFRRSLQPGRTEARVQLMFTVASKKRQVLS